MIERPDPIWVRVAWHDSTQSGRQAQQKRRMSPFSCSGDPHLLSAVVSGGKGQEGRVDGLHAETAHHPQCDGEEPDAVASGKGTGLCPGIGEPGLDGDRRFYATCVRRILADDSEHALLGT